MKIAPSLAELSDLPPAQARLVDEACNRFEAAWLSSDARPHLEDFLPSSDSWPDEAAGVLLRELILLDVHYRRQAGDKPQSDDYLARFPTLDTAWLGDTDLELAETKDAPADTPQARGAPRSFNFLSAPERPDEIGRLGPYRVLKVLGSGGMGFVLLAEDPRLNRLVALKVPHANLLDEKVSLERFQREARAAAQLRHPHIVTVYEVATLNGLPVIVAEYVPGILLKDLLEQRRLTYAEAAALIAQFAETLDYAHSMGVVHRDVKPGNIMLETPTRSASEETRDGQESGVGGQESGINRPSAGEAESPPVFRVRILDFGLALHDSAETRLTMDGHVLGTPAYMSPEQAAGQSRSIDRRSDIYSLGVVFYEMLTGTLPFRGSRLMLLDQVLHREPNRPRNVDRRIPRDLETICLKCLAKTPAARFPSARDLAEELQRHLRGEPIRTRPLSFAEKTLRWCRRNPALAGLSSLAAIGFVLALAVFVGAFFMVQSSRNEAVELAQKEKAERIKTQKMLLDSRFNTYHAAAADNFAEAMVGSIQLMPAALDLEHAFLADSIRLHIGAWSLTVNPLRHVVSHQGPVRTGAFSPDGNIAATSGDDKTVKLWDLVRGQAVRPDLAHASTVLALVFDGDGKRLYTGCADNSVWRWNLSTGAAQVKKASFGGGSNFVALSPDGRTALSAQGTVARLWDVASGKAIGEPLRHQDNVAAVTFSPDGRSAATASWDRTARLWNVADAKPCGQPLVHEEKAASVAFSPDGRTLAVGSLDKMVSFWRVDSGARLETRLRSNGGVLALAYSPDGKLLLAGTNHATAGLWDLATGAPLGPPMQHQEVVHAVAFAPDGKHVLTSSYDRSARLWQLASGSVFSVLRNQGKVRTVAFSPDAQTVVTCCDDGSARLWKRGTGEPIGAPLQHKGVIESVAFSPDGKSVLTGSFDHTAQLWDTNTGLPLAPPLRHPRQVLAVAFRPDGAAALTGCSDALARLWDPVAGKTLGAAMQHKELVVVLAFSPDGSRAVTGSYDGKARLWDAATGAPLGEPLAHQDRVVAVAFSPDGKSVLTGSWDRTAQLWDTAGGSPLGPPLRHQDKVNCVAFSPDGRSLLTGSYDKTARLWDAASGRALVPPLRHKGILTTAAFSPDGKIVLTGSLDHTARLWEAATGKQLGPPLKHNDAVRHAAFSPDGSCVLTGSWDRTARIWEVPAAVNGDPARILLWAQVTTGVEVDDMGSARALDADVWHQRRRQLESSSKE